MLKEYLDTLEEIISEKPRSSALKSFFMSVIVEMFRKKIPYTIDDFMEYARQKALHLNPPMRFHIIASLAEAKARMVVSV